MISLLQLHPERKSVFWLGVATRTVSARWRAGDGARQQRSSRRIMLIARLISLPIEWRPLKDEKSFAEGRSKRSWRTHRYSLPSEGMHSSLLQ